MNRRTVAALGAVVVFAGWGGAAPPTAGGGAALIVIEDAPRNQQRLVRLRFRDGKLAGRDDILTADQRFFIRTTRHHLAPDGKHLVSASGGVVRLADGAVLSREQDGEFLGFDGTGAVYRVENAHRENGVFAFDFANEKVIKLARPGGWGLPGVRSPGNAKSVRRDVPLGQVSELRLATPDPAAPAGWKDVSLGKDFHVNYSRLSSGFGAPAVLWLDDDRFVAQVGNGKLVVVKADGSRTPVLNVPGDAEVISDPEFRRDADGNVIYHCGKSTVRVDLDARKWTAYDWVPLGHGFEAARNPAADGRHVVRYRGKEVGRVWCQGPHGTTAPGLLAVITKPDADVFSEPDEVRVWAAASGTWTILKMAATDLVGWVP